MTIIHPIRGYKRKVRALTNKRLLHYFPNKSKHKELLKRKRNKKIRNLVINEESQNIIKTKDPDIWRFW
jgi:hypothetical protein